MDAKLSPHSPRRGRPWAIRPWTLVVLALLLAAGTLIQACSDNNGTTGPTFSCNESQTGSGSARTLAACTTGTQGPVPVVGNVGAGLKVAVQVNPGTIDIGRRASVIVIVTSGGNSSVATQAGAGIPGRTVRLAATGGSLDATSGTTDENGVFATTMVVPCGTTAGGGSVTAIVDGVASTPGAFTSVTAVSNDPCA
jgi:hypothetical protein